MEEKSFRNKFEVIKKNSEKEIKSIENEMKEKGEKELAKLKDDARYLERGLDEYAKDNTESSFPNFNEY
ncbi:MAG: hypothetical protein ACRC6T_13365 [Sarcina sp.]